MNVPPRHYLAEKGLHRFLVGALSRSHFDRYLDLALAWTGDDAPTLDDVNELVAASGSSRIIR